MENKILIYGANGYTGKLFANFLREKGQKAVLAARSDKMKPLAEKLAWEYRVFPTDKATEFLSDIDVLINLAGPFSKTQSGLIRACIDTNTHYLDIAGEVPEMENAYTFNQEALRAGIKLIPGAGFGVVPTDIAAKLASEKIENPTQLELIFATEGGASRGTLFTVLKDIQKPGIEVVDGKTVAAKPAKDALSIKLGSTSKKAVYNPWRADLFTAQLSTEIPNIKTYSVFPGFVVSMMKGKLAWLRAIMLKYLIRWLPEGPNQKQLEKGYTAVEARVSNKKGEQAKVRIEGPEAYFFTVETVFAILQAMESVDKNGFICPSAFGISLLESIPRVQIKHA